MSNLNFLSKLNLSSNNLMGKIPTGSQLQSFEASSFVGNNLCGPPLPKNWDDLQNIPNRLDDKEGKRNGVNWFYVSMSLGFVSGFWIVVGPLLYSRSWSNFAQSCKPAIVKKLIKGIRENTIVFILVCSLTSSLDPLCKCKASDQVLCIPSERQALLNFKQHLHDPSNRLVTWSDDNTNCCNWTSVSYNHETGIIPPWVGDILLNLKIFLLKSNQFNGKIPNQICSLNSLHILDLAQNNLTGQIPKCINQLSVMLVKNTTLESDIYGERNGTSLSITDVLLELKGKDDVYTWLGLFTSIDLSGNKLCGEVPSEITSLKGLHFLNLSNNLLSGKIPQNIGNMEWLESMDLSENQLYGEIPSSMSNLNFLSKLNFSFNNVMGKIPTGTLLQSFKASSFGQQSLWSSTTKEL
ncbi:receptor-like protein EIX2 [Neltuma alba]|uniref:receptor-like protein EIX2 n=1 Tax=Neltuma alba TaxID=207710 RepID=UPI0010A4C580|nr:receptor-like protein EIX2 [Prosopis alba]